MRLACTIARRRSSIPPQDRFRSHDLRHLFQRFASQSFGRRSQADALGIVEPDSAFDLTAQDPVLGHQIFISCQELFVNRSRDAGQHSLPVHWLKFNQCAPLKATSRSPRKCLKVDSFDRFDTTGYWASARIVRPETGSPVNSLEILLEVASVSFASS